MGPSSAWTTPERRRRPELTALHAAVRKIYQSFLATCGEADLRCPRCGCDMEIIIAFILDQPIIRRILECAPVRKHIWLPEDSPVTDSPDDSEDQPLAA